MKASTVQFIWLCGENFYERSYCLFGHKVTALLLYCCDKGLGRNARYNNAFNNVIKYAL